MARTVYLLNKGAAKTAEETEARCSLVEDLKVKVEEGVLRQDAVAAGGRN